MAISEEDLARWEAAACAHEEMRQHIVELQAPQTVWLSEHRTKAALAVRPLIAEVRRLRAALAALRSRGEAMMTWADREPDDDTYRSGVAQGLCEAWDEVADAARHVLGGEEAEA